jgi:hypothetical protein
MCNDLGSAYWIQVQSIKLQHPTCQPATPAALTSHREGPLTQAALSVPATESDCAEAQSPKPAPYQSHPALHTETCAIVAAGMQAPSKWELSLEALRQPGLRHTVPDAHVNRSHIKQASSVERIRPFTCPMTYSSPLWG